VSLIERGLRRPSLDTLERLLLATGHRLAEGLEVVPTEEDPVHLAAEQRLSVGARVQGGLNGVELFNILHGAARR
jgi:hypothetical protein